MLKPKSEKELADMVATAIGPLRISGGGTRGIINTLNGDSIETLGLTGISLYDPGALTLVAGAGTPIEDIENALAAEGQYLAFEPMDYRGLINSTGTPTIGGVFATNNSGPRRIQTGAARDFLLGVRFVDGKGHIIKNGGRVMKNVTGYDLVKLMCGSFGTLGIISEVAMKVLPAPKMQATVLISGLSDEQAVKAMSAALGSPFDISGAAHISASLAGQSSTLIRLEGFADSVTYRSKQIQNLLSPAGQISIETDKHKSADLWKNIRDVSAFHQTVGDVWRISIRPSIGPSLAKKLNAIQIVHDWGGGLIWALMPSGANVRSLLGEFDGHATLVRSTNGVGAASKIFQPESSILARLSQGLRDKFDPRGIFNVGLMGNLQ